MDEFSIRCDDVWRLFLPVIGVSRETAWVRIDDESITYHFGWFEEVIPLRSVERGEAMTWPWFYGVGMRVAPGSTLGLVGSTQGVAAITLAEPIPIKVPFTMKFTKIAASLENRDGFLDALDRRLQSVKKAPR